MFFRITAEPDISQVCASVHTALEDFEGFKDMAWHGTETQLVRSFPTCKMAYEDRIHGMHLRRLGELLACIWPERAAAAIMKLQNPRSFFRLMGGHISRSR